MAINLGAIDNPDPEDTRDTLQLGSFLGSGAPIPPGHFVETGPSADNILDSDNFWADQKRHAAGDQEHLLDPYRRLDATAIEGAQEMYALSVERAQQRLNGIAREEEQLNLHREAAERENAREKREKERELREAEREIRERERVEREQARDLRDQNREIQEKQYKRRSMQVMVATLVIAIFTLIVAVAGLFL